MLYTISGSKTVVGIQSRTLRKWNVLTRKKNKWHTSILFDLAAPPHGAGAGDVSFVRLAEHWSLVCFRSLAWFSHAIFCSNLY